MINLPIDGLLKVLLMILGPTAVALILYLRGRTDGYNKGKEEQRDAKERLDYEIKKIEKTNQDLEREADELVDKVNNPSTISDELIRLWAERGYGSGSSKDPKTDKKTES